MLICFWQVYAPSWLTLSFLSNSHPHTAKKLTSLAKLLPMFLQPHLMHYSMMLKHLLILILPSLSTLTLTLTCLTSCWKASVKVLSTIDILIRRVQLQSVDVNVKMKCINFSLELTLWWRCKTSIPSSTTVLFLGGNYWLTNSRILKCLLSSILQFLLHLLHLSVSGAELQEFSLLNKMGCRKRLLLQ